MLDPIVKTIDVPCGQEQAFTVFVNNLNSWWPRDKNSVSAMQGEVAIEIILEPQEGGAIVEIGHDNTRHRWGTVTRYDPYGSIALDWHINMPAEKASRVDVTFLPLDDNTTRVELTHSNWEVFGDSAADMRAGYDSGWVGVFEQAYKNACTTP